jgi:alkane 1-monooxygenase
MFSPRFLKYALVYIIPALFVAGCFLKGWMSYAPLLFAFGVIPLLELVFEPDPKNVDAAEQELRKNDRMYDAMLYLVVPVVYGCIGLFLWKLSNTYYAGYEITGLVLSLGVVLGGMGINVAHELGHRATPYEQAMAKLLLLPSAYMHFYIEHNRGHHKNVSTWEDPASARYNETVFLFWLRSVVYSYISAWKLEHKRLERLGKRPFSLENEMLRFQLIQLAFWAGIWLAFGTEITWLYTGAAVTGFLLLETVNYIEHYGLERMRLNANRYEKVSPIHSWNSNHVVGRVMLFELSRHSDHHYQPAKKYQLLEHHDQSPQMPTGYPGMMLLSLVPPLWFAIMNRRVKQYKGVGHRVAPIAA